MTNRAEKIDQIIAARKPIAEKTTKTVEHLKNISFALQRCDSLLQSVLIKDIAPEQKESVKRCLAELKRYSDELIPERTRELGQLERRFNRPTLNIGVVGNAGQGKSTLLQRLTGLSEEEIPTGSKGDCTGAAAIIENSPVNETYADIEFYTEHEFLERIVSPYYRDVFNLPQPTNLMEFAQPLPNEVIHEHYDEARFVQRLQDGLNEYRPYLGEQGKRISKNEIRKYTAKSDQDGQLLSIWAAVKFVRIYCSFPDMGAEKISVGDTPGLGDRSVLGAEDLLMKDFGSNIDAVIMLRRVNVRGIRKEDVNLYSLIKRAVPELPAEKWSYFMVNVFPNEREVGPTNEFLKFLPEDFKKSSLKEMQECIELNCFDREEVKLKFNDILDKIAVNQQDLDNTLYNSRFEKCKQLLSNLSTFVGQMANLFPQISGDSADSALAKELFSEVWENLGVKLNECVEQWKSRKNDDSQEFLDNITSVETSLKDIPGLPDIAQVKKQAAVRKIIVVYGDKCQEIRRLIIERFEELDRGFNELFDKLRNEALQCFCDGEGGQLENVWFGLDEKQENKNKIWWTMLAEELAVLGQTDKYRDIAQRIAKAIRRFVNASLSFRETLLPRIIPHFDSLDTDNPEKNGPFCPKQFNDPQEVIDCLDAAARNAIGEAIIAVKTLSKEPSMAVYAAIEELRDAVIRTGGHSNAEYVWSVFYSSHRSEVWPEKFQVREADAKFRSDWQKAVEVVQNIIRQ